MSQFTENCHIQPHPKSNLWVTTDELTYHIGSEDSYESITVPEGFIFDGASVPMVFGWLIQRVEPRTISPACVHDWLYTKGRQYTQKKTDQIFYESLLVSGVPKRKALIMYIGVRAGGRLYWNKLI